MNNLTSRGYHGRHSSAPRQRSTFDASSFSGSHKSFSSSVIRGGGAHQTPTRHTNPKKDPLSSAAFRGSPQRPPSAGEGVPRRHFSDPLPSTATLSAVPPPPPPKQRPDSPSAVYRRASGSHRRPSPSPPAPPISAQRQALRERVARYSRTRHTAASQADGESARRAGVPRRPSAPEPHVRSSRSFDFDPKQAQALRPRSHSFDVREDASAGLRDGTAGPPREEQRERASEYGKERRDDPSLNPIPGDERSGQSEESKESASMPSHFWDTAASALEDTLGTLNISTPPKTSGRKPSSSQAAASQSRGTQSTRRSGGQNVRENVDTSNMPSVSSDEPTRLYALIKRREWAEVVNHAKVDKGEAGTWVVERNADGTPRWRLLPLHQACEMQPPEEVVKALIVAYPPAVGMKDSGGDLPLHLACRERSSASVVHSLILADPDAARVADDEGRLPLHLACRQGAGIDIVEKLLVTYHRGAKTTDSYGLLPLHWACAQNATVPIVEALLRANPYAVDVKDKWGRTPLSLAQASTNSDKEAIIVALNRDSSFWTTSLLNEVDELKGKVETQTSRAQHASSKASTLEKKLAEVMAASTSAAMSFQELRNELESENARLKDEVEDLTPRVAQSEERIQFLEQENADLRGNVEELADRLGRLTEVFRAMEEQRLKILQVTGEWEESLSQAAELVLIDGDGSVLSEQDRSGQGS